MPTDLRISIHIGVRDGARAAYPVQLQQEGKPLADVWAPIDLQSLLEHEHAASARDYGMALYDTLFAGAIGRAYQRLQGQAGGEGSIRVQLVIHPNAPELHALAWERLFQVFGDEEAPLAANAQTPFSRFLTSGAGDQDPIADHPLRLLIAVANPLDLPQSLAPIDVVGEVAALADALGDRRGRLRVTLVPGVTGLPQELRLRITQELGWTIADGVASWQAIQSQLPNQHLVHILAHGHLKQGEHPGEGTAYLLLEHPGDANKKKAMGSIEGVADETLAVGLHNLHPCPQLVFLAACDSAKRPAGAPADAIGPFVGLAPKLVLAGVPAVVAMQDLVPMDLARTLTAHFYRRLFEHGQVDRALNEARALLLRRQAFAWAVPVLFLRLAHGRLFSPANAEPLLRTLFDGLIEDYTRLFAGREDQLASLSAFMDQPSGGYLLIKAGAGLGKTALAANLVDSHRDRLAYHFFSPRESEGLKEEVFLRSLLEQMAPWYGIEPPRAGTLADLRKRYDALLGEPPRSAGTVLIDGLDEVVGWDLSRYLSRRIPDGLHFILTVRDLGQDPASDYEIPLAQLRTESLPGLDRAGVRSVLLAAGGAASGLADDEALVTEIMRVTLYDQAHQGLGADPFFLRFLAEDAARGDLNPGDMAKLPAQMQAYLARWWEQIRSELGEQGRRAELDPPMLDLIGTLTAALGPIQEADLKAVNPSLVHPLLKRFFDEVVRRVSRIVARDAQGGYSLLHPRLRGYLQALIETKPYTQRLLDYCRDWHAKHWDKQPSPYALTYAVRHLAETVRSASDPAPRLAVATELVALVQDRDFQVAYLAAVEDPSGLQADLERTLDTVAALGEPALVDKGLILVVQSARALVRFRRERLRPEHLFDLARRGDIQAARRLLDLFDPDPNWRHAALLAIGWLAPESAAAQRQALYAEVESDTLDLPEGDHRREILQRIRGQGPREPLPPPPGPDELRALLDSAGGVSSEADVNPELLARVLGSASSLLAAGTDIPSGGAQVSDAIFLSHYVGPPLVALALASPPEGEAYLREYLAAHSAYSYSAYRFGSLWALLGAVLRHPDPDWVRQRLPDLAIAALAGHGVEHEESLPLSILAAQARAGDQAASRRLVERVEQSLREADRLASGRKSGDVWGRYMRLLGALAEIAARFSLPPGLDSAALLQRARTLHHGYAGYRAPACLTLTESIRVCGPVQARDWITGLLDSARAAAHNVQEGTFCARTTARVNAMRAFWWPDGGLDVGRQTDTLRHRARAPELASLHHMGETYAERGKPPQSWPLPASVKEAHTLAGLASVYQRRLADFLRLNREWEPQDRDIPWDHGIGIRVPDPGLAPLLAARFAAEALVQPGLADTGRADLIRALVPVAAPNPTALDTVLARLVLAQAPSDPTVLDRLAAIAPLPEHPPEPLMGELTRVPP